MTAAKLPETSKKSPLFAGARTLSGADELTATGHLADLAQRADEEGFPDFSALLMAPGSDRHFLGSVMVLSEYLRSCLQRRPEILGNLLNTSIEARIEAINEEIAALRRSESLTEKALMSALRRAKVEAHVLIALDDLAGFADVEATTRRLSRLADACIVAAVDFLLDELCERGKMGLPAGEGKLQSSGLFVLAMGKLGGHELNYSSDIDLVVFYEADSSALVDPLDATDLYSRLAKRLVRILQERTEDGYVFRTDLRLRPDPGATPLAISVEAALTYYEARGQNWERAAMIKARPVAGDIDAGEAFLIELQPFVWRKYMDFAAIADVHSIKRQIHAHKGHGAVAVRGHNVKLGRGGIREIEFFAQTQQLIAGGRFPELRSRQTIAALNALAERQWITAKAQAILIDRYHYLRRVEHAIQMLRDEQTQIVPEDEQDFEKVAALLGHATAKLFDAELRATLADVEKQYAALFENGQKLSADLGNLVFTGDGDDPDTLKTLSRLGFERPADISRVIRSWHFGRYRATRSAEARERLTELTPALLRALGETRAGDEALMRFDTFLAGLPAGIQLFSLLQSNPSLLSLLGTVMSAAPRLAAIITRRPHVFDGLLDPALLTELPNKTYLAARLEAFADPALGYEERLDRLRIFASEQKFLIGIRLITGAIDAARAGKGFSDLADLTIAATLDAVRSQLELRHGRVSGGKVVILGMGKLGSRELTAGSDVDLILLYDHDEAADISDGAKGLAPSQYYARLTQRLIAAVSAPTAEGVLYELDLRLRPSGNQGPIATHIAAFDRYQREVAWTWEHMALTRARVVAGDAELASLVEDIIAKTLDAPYDARKILKDSAAMRLLLDREKPPRDGWDLKLIPGGLIDLEFVAQLAMLAGGVEPTGRRLTATAEILAQLTPTFASATDRDTLVEAIGCLQGLTQIMRLCLTGPFERDMLSQGLGELMSGALALPDFSILEAQLKAITTASAEVCRRLLQGHGRLRKRLGHEQT